MHIHIQTHIHAYICTCMHTQAHIHPNTHPCTYTHITCIHTRTHTSIYKHTDKHLCAHIYTYRHHTHMHIHAYTHVSLLKVITLKRYHTYCLINSTVAGRWWWRTPLIPWLWRQKQVDLCKFEASLVYKESSRTGSKATEKPCLEKQKQSKKRHC